MEYAMGFVYRKRQKIKKLKESAPKMTPYEELLHEEMKRRYTKQKIKH